MPFPTAWGCGGYRVSHQKLARGSLSQFPNALYYKIYLRDADGSGSYKGTDMKKMEELDATELIEYSDKGVKPKRSVSFTSATSIAYTVLFTTAWRIGRMPRI